jgi:hypothetical protein
MAIINNNVQNVKFLRNQTPFESRELARQALEDNKGVAADGTALLARYTVSGEVKTLVGFVAEVNSTKYVTIIDVEGASGDVEELRKEINAKLGSGITSANTATAQLAALSGNNESTSAETSVEGAKRYAEDLISELDGSVTAEAGSYVKSVTEVDGKISGTTEALPTVAAISESGKAITAVSESNGTISATAGTINSLYVTASGFTATDVQGVLEEVNANIGKAISGLDVSDTAVPGEYVSQVSEEDGKISVTRVALPSSADTAQAKKVVIAVSEDKGQIEVSRGEITSSGKTIVLTDGSDGGVNFETNIDGVTLQKDENGVISVTSSALVQYEGDDNTIQISAVNDGVRTVSSPLTIQKVTTGLSTNVKEEYHLIGHSGTTIGSPIQIYKDSALVNFYLGHVDDFLTDEDSTTHESPTTAITNGTGDTALVWVMQLANGNYKLSAVNVESFLQESEFASGLTADSETHIVRGVVDSSSETFLTVGENGFKLTGVQDAINSAVNALDAVESGKTTHISVTVGEADGVLTAVTVTEDNIANADDLAELSGKTVTAITSNNGSITAQISEAAGNKSYNIETDASKIKMSGFDSTGALSGITTSSSITEAFGEVESVIEANERVTAEALTDLDGRLDVVEDEYISGVSVNGNAVTVANKIAPISITPATSATTPTSTEAITVQTDANGNITLGISSIDCGYYS